MLALTTNLCNTRMNAGKQAKKADDLPFVAYRQLPQAGESNLPGLFAEARHSILRSGLASVRARRTPAAS